MTSEEFTDAAEFVMTSAVNCLVVWAFQSMPPERVERVVALWMDTMKDVAIRAVRNIAAAGGPGGPRAH